MAKLVVPPLDSRLAEIFNKVLQTKVLDDDNLWSHECLPLLYSRLDALHNLVREAQISNANTPDMNIVDDIFKTVEKIKAHLNDHFKTGAPFTVHRLGELLVDYSGSGYLLNTVVLAQKYVLALARTIRVLSKETDYSVTLGDPSVLGDGDYTINGLFGDDKDEAEKTANGLLNGTHYRAITENAFNPEKTPTLKRLREIHKDTELASAQDYEDHDLPTNIRFVSLPWAEPQISSNVQDFDVEHSASGVEVVESETHDQCLEVQSPPLKKMKNTCEKGNAIPEKSLFQLISPLKMDGKLGEECSQNCYEEKPLDYKVDRTERYSEEVLF